MHISSSAWCLLLATLLPAQTPSPAVPSPTAPAALADAAGLAAAKQRLSQALQKSARIADTAFTAQWGPDGKAPQGIAGTHASSGNAAGSWHADRLHLTFEEKANDVVFAGRAQLAKQGDGDWTRRQRRFVDGAEIGFVPDPLPALQQLAGWDLAVTAHKAGSLDDRPVDVVSVSLTPEQVADALWTGVLDESMARSSMATLFARAKRQGAAGAMVMAPDAKVDLVVHLDPATGVVHQLQFRCWVTSPVGAGGRMIVRQGGGVVQVQNAEEKPEEAPPAKDAIPTDGSVFDDGGFPVRARKDTTVVDYTLRLREHGKCAAPPLSDAQKRLLGL